MNFNLEYWQALAFMGLLTAFYLVLGGYRSMTVLDVVFGVLMLAGGTVMFISLLGKAGGLAAATAQLEAIDPRLVRAVGPPGLWPLAALVFAFFGAMYWAGSGVLAPVAMSMIADISEINKHRTGVLKDGSYAAMFSIHYEDGRTGEVRTRLLIRDIG